MLDARCWFAIEIVVKDVIADEICLFSKMSILKLFSGLILCFLLYPVLIVRDTALEENVICCNIPPSKYLIYSKPKVMIL
jgi:hypothetical protein